MKITDVTLTLFAWPGIPSTTYGRHTGRFGGDGHLGLLTLATDAGVEGHAFLGSAMRGAHLDSASLIEVLKPVVLGQDPLDRERLYHALWQRSRSTTARAIGAVDVALWDLAGKVAGLPIHRLLGSYRDRVRAYASSAVLGSPEAYGEEAARFKAEGWTAYKIHPPTDPATDIAVCQAVRRAVGDGYAVMLDGSWAYDYPTALPATGHRGSATTGTRIRRRRRHLQPRRWRSTSAPHPGHRLLLTAYAPFRAATDFRWRRRVKGGSPAAASGGAPPRPT
jgi:L-alanine-DL-glutamate epimerase-like enolase superfamily enzyme